MKKITDLVLELNKSPDAIKMIAALPIEFYSFDYLDKTFDKSSIINYNGHQLKRTVCNLIPCWIIAPENQVDLSENNFNELTWAIDKTYLLIFRTLKGYWKGKLYSYNKKSRESVYYPGYDVSVSEMREIKKIKKTLSNPIINFI